MNTRLLGLLLLAFCVIAEVTRELCFKWAATHSAPEAPGYVRRLLHRPLTWAGFGLWAVEAVAWIAVLGHLPLGVAFPVMTVSYAAVPLAGVLVLGERLNRSQIAGAALVAVGAGCIGWTGA